MKKVFDIALICVIIIVAFYACSEEIFSSYEENLVLNSNDPRLEMVASVDSAKRKRENIETLSVGENMVDVNQQVYITREIRKFYNHSRKEKIVMSVSVLAATDSLANFIYPSFYQEVQGYPVNVNVTIPSSVGSGVHWTCSSSRATIASPKTILVEVRGVFHDYMGFFRDGVYENVNVDISSSLSLY